MITAQQYSKNVLARASREWHGDKLDIDDFQQVLEDFIKAGQALDRLKKTLFYGTDFFLLTPEIEPPVETPTPQVNTFRQQLIHAMIGAATESAELMEALASWLPNLPEAEIDVINLQEEFGDIAWYRELGLSALATDHWTNIDQNDRKLSRRYGPAFSAEATNNRNLSAERKELES